MNKLKYFKMYIIFLVLAMLCNSIDSSLARDCYFLSRSDTLRPMASTIAAQDDLELLTSKLSQSEALIVDEALNKIRRLLQTVDGKTTLRPQVTPAIKQLLLEYKRDGKQFFTPSKAKEIARIRKLGQRLDSFRYTLLLKDNGDFKFNAVQVTEIVKSISTKEQIRSIITRLKKYHIGTGGQIIMIIKSSKHDEIEFIAESLIALNIKSPFSIAKIFQSKRDWDEIERIIKTLRSLGIDQESYIVKIIATSRDEEEIKRIVRHLQSLGMQKTSHITKILQGKCEEETIKKFSEVLLSYAKKNKDNKLTDFLISNLIAKPTFLINGLESTFKRRGELPSFEKYFSKEDKEYIEFRVFLKNFDKKTIFLMLDALFSDNNEIKELRRYIDEQISADRAKLASIEAVQNLSEGNNITAGLLLFSFSAEIRKRIHVLLINSNSYALRKYRHDANLFVIAEDILMYDCSNYNIYERMLSGEIGPSRFATYLYGSLRYTKTVNFYDSLPESLRPLRREVNAFVREYVLTHGDRPSDYIIISEFISRGNDEKTINRTMGKTSLSLDDSTHNTDIPLIELVFDQRHDSTLSSYSDFPEQDYMQHGAEVHLSPEEVELYDQYAERDSNARSSSAGIVTNQKEAVMIDQILNEIRNAFLTVNGKTVLRKDINPPLERILLKITRGGAQLFDAKQAQKLAKIRKLDERCDTLKYLLRLRSNDKFVFSDKDIARMLHSPRTLLEIKSITNILGLYGIKKGAYIKKVTMSTREDEKIETIIKRLKALKVEDGFNIAKILQSDRDEDEIERIIINLRSLGIEEEVYIASILATSRSEDEIDRLVHRFRSIGVKENGQIAKMLQSSWNEKEIGSLAEILFNYIKKKNGHKLTNASIAQVLASPVFLRKGFDYVLNREGRLPSFEKPFTEEDKHYIKFRLFLRDLNKKVTFSIIDAMYKSNEKAEGLKNLIGARIIEDENKLVTLESRRRLFGNDHTITGLLLFSFDADIRKRASAVFVKKYDYVLYKYRKNEDLLSVAGEILSRTAYRYNIYDKMLAGEIGESKYKTYLFISLRYIHKANFYNNLPESLLPLRKEVTVYIKEFALVYGTKPSEVTILSKFLKRGYEEEEIMHAIGKGFLSLDRPVSNSRGPLIDLIPDEVENPSLNSYLYGSSDAHGAAIYASEAYLLSQEAGIAYDQYDDLYAKSSSAGVDSFSDKHADKVEEKIIASLQTIIHEHNRATKDESKQIRDFSVIESKEKFIGEGGKLWARIMLTFGNGVSRKFIFKHEKSYAMDEIGSETLKILNIDMPRTRKYGNSYFLIEAIGQFNLNKVTKKQYLNHNFSSRLAYLAGETAVRALIIGLADRKGDNLRVILDKNNLPKKILNVDLTSAFTYTKKQNLEIAISEGVFILMHILKAANNAGVKPETLKELTSLFIDGFQNQFHKFQDDYLKIEKSFNDINPDIYDQLDKKWSVMDIVKSKKDNVLAFINPQKMHISNFKAILLKAILKGLSSFSSSSKVKGITIVMPLTAA